jgi:hypothetical protein
MKTRVFAAEATLLLLILLLFVLSVIPSASAADEKIPYGRSQSGVYGEKTKVSTKEAARRILKEYFSGKNVTIGQIREKDYYFEADILDSHGKIVDEVIVDKRTGRIRSIY